MMLDRRMENRRIEDRRKLGGRMENRRMEDMTMLGRST
jgi:hypothetical protein